jgi:hypothetical protein
MLVGLYPELWRERYREEMLVLLDDDPPGARGLATMLLGAADAHLRPRSSWSSGASRQASMRLSLGGMFSCWIALSLAGIGFQKDTEDPAFATASARHPLLGLAHAAVLAGACLGAASIAAGGLPLLWQALLTTIARRERRLALLVVSPVLGVALMGAFTALLLAIAPSRGGGFPASFVLEILLPWTLAIYACALLCALVPRAVLRRIEVSPSSMRRACLAGGPLAVAMCLIAAGLVLYAPAMWLGEPGLAGRATGPYGASTGAMLGVQALTAVIFAELGVVGARRARRAAR